MFSLEDSEVYYLSCTATDMRRGVRCTVRRGLSWHGPGSDKRGGVHLLQLDPYALEAFPLGARGLRVYHKRFERGILTLPRLEAREGGYQVSWRELALMVEGVELERIRSRKRYDISLKNSTNSARISL